MPDSYETGWLQEMWKSGTRLCKQRNCGVTGEFEPFSWLILSPSPGFATTWGMSPQILKSRRLHARDSNLPYRDEQRAWYDTLRDLVPTLDSAAAKSENAGVVSAPWEKALSSSSRNRRTSRSMALRMRTS